MSTPMQRNETSPSVLMTYDRDGLADIFIGLVLLLFGVCLWADMPYMAGVFPAVLLPVWQSAKRSLVAPRLTGMETHAGAEQAAASAPFKGLLVGVLVLVGAVLLTLLVAARPSPWLHDWISQYFDLVFGLGAASFLGLMALARRVPRYAAYAALALFIFAGGYLLAIPFPLSVSLLGAVMVLGGTMQLIEFLVRYPPRHELS